MTEVRPRLKDELFTKIAPRMAASPRLAANWQSLAFVFTLPEILGELHTSADDGSPGVLDWSTGASTCCSSIHSST